MLLDNKFINDRRVYRTATELVNMGHKVVLLCNKDDNLNNQEIIDGIQVYRIFDNTLYDFKNVTINNKIISVLKKQLCVWNSSRQRAFNEMVFYIILTKNI